VKRQVDAGSLPSVEELVRFENAQAARNVGCTIWRRHGAIDEG
jgi:hypothetical protein